MKGMGKGSVKEPYSILGLHDSCSRMVALWSGNCDMVSDLLPLCIILKENHSLRGRQENPHENLIPWRKCSMGLRTVLGLKLEKPSIKVRLVLGLGFGENVG